MKCTIEESRTGVSYHWTGFAAAGVLAVALAGCGGGGGGDSFIPAPAAGAGGVTAVVGAPPAPPAPTGTAPITLTAATPPATFASLTPVVAVGGVAIASPPIVTFSVSDGSGNAIIGLGSTSKSSTATVASYPNLAFSLAKLVPGTNGAPSKWVSYIVTTVPTKNATGAITASTATRPTTDNTGTLTDYGNGVYVYKFYRDITQVKAQVAAMTLTGANVAADLGDLTYDPTLTHRLTIAISGNAPGTGTNQPDGVAKSTTDAVPMTSPINIVYDFVPATGKAATTADAQREIAATAKCNECHNKLGGIPNKDSTKAGFHGGGRYNTQYCVVCHTDQRKFGRSNVASTAGAFPALTETKGTVNAFGSTGSSSYSPLTYVADGEVLGDFPVLIHKIHFGNNIAGAKKLTKTNYNFANVLFNNLVFPQNPGNCVKCHDGTTGAANATLQGDNWKAVPTRKACGACHDGIIWSTGKGNTLNLKPAGSTVNTNGHRGGAMTDDSTCALCHDAASVATYHSDTLVSTSDASKRTMSAEITGVTIDVAPASKTAASLAATTSTGTGNVTVTFKLTDGGVPVTGAYGTAWSGLAFTLAKLNFAENGASTNWQSYTQTSRTSDPLKPPVIQGYSETAAAANLTHTGGGVWTYKFLMQRASTAGDIRTVSVVNNRSSTSGASGVTVPPYSAAAMPSLPNATLTDTAQTTVPYEWWKTHRVAMMFSKGTGATAVTNKFNAVYDFVPTADSARPAQTRNIVSMDTCATCHNGVRLHSRYTVEMCVTCHNKNTGDPNTGVLNAAGTGVTFTPVDLQRIVHKLHMGADLPSVRAGGALFKINHQEFSGRFPGIIKDCVVCHSATAKKPDGKTVLENAANWYTMPTKIACGSCHDSTSALGHIDANVSASGVEQCNTCHKVGSVFGLDVAGVHKVR